MTLINRSFFYIKISKYQIQDDTYIKLDFLITSFSFHKFAYCLEVLCPQNFKHVYIDQVKTFKMSWEKIVLKLKNFALLQ